MPPEQVRRLLWAAFSPAGTSTVGSRASFGLVVLSSFVAAIFSWVVASWLTRRRPISAKFAAMLIGLTISTAGFTAFFFFLQHFFESGREHAPFLSRAFLVEVFYSGLSLTYLFAVTGLRLFLPAGLVVLLVASFAFARRQEL